MEAKASVVLCLISVTGIIFNNCDGGGNNRIDFNTPGNVECATLKRLGYKDYPGDIAEWEKAFLLILHENLLLVNEKSINEKEIIYWKNKYKKIISVSIVRSKVELVARRFKYHFYFPPKPRMMNLLKNSNNTTFKIQLDPLQLLLLGNWPSYHNIHSVEWFYYLLFCDNAYAQQLRKTLADSGVDVFKFCKLIGEIYETIRIHGIYDPEITDDEIIQGFKLYGIECPMIHECVYVLRNLSKLKGDFGKIKSK